MNSNASITRTGGSLKWPVTVSVLPASGFNLALSPEPDEMELLAQELDVLVVERFRAELRFMRWKRDGIKVIGEIRADLVQECSSTLVPVKTALKEQFEALFVPEGSRLSKPPIGPDGELVFAADGDDLPDTFVGDKLDAWEITLEHALLAIDPFVRDPDAVLDHPAMISEAELEQNKAESSPFSVLGKLKTPKKD